MSGQCLKFPFRFAFSLGLLLNLGSNLWHCSLAHAAGERKNRFSFSPSLGYSRITYQETQIPDYSENALTFKLGVARNFSRIDTGILLYGTVLAISKNQSPIARFVGVNFRAGFAVIAKPAWRLTLMTGYYYTTMLVNGNTFGFKNMAGPQLFPLIQKIFKGGNILQAYFKYSPVSNKFTLLSALNREIAYGGAYTLTLSGGKRSISFTVDVATLQLVINNITIHSDSTTVGIGYGF